MSILSISLTYAQSFAPPPGFLGSTAIHKDSSVIIGWASSAQITRGPLNIQSPGLGDASYGVDMDALGVADNLVVSLGDGGEALITFNSPIANGAGPDFAIFENGFANNYMEFAFIEVSSDGINFTRFDAVSETPSLIQIDNFSFSDCAYINNLAGKYRVFYGTPFDLEELVGTAGLNVNNITHIRLIDVVGSIDHSFGTFDSQGNIINDPYPTEFESGGFDLDAVGVIHDAQSIGIEENELFTSVYPNPVTSSVQCKVNGAVHYTLFSTNGRAIFSGEALNEFQLDLSELSQGIYYLQVNEETIRLVKE